MHVPTDWHDSTWRSAKPSVNRLQRTHQQQALDQCTVKPNAGQDRAASRPHHGAQRAVAVASPDIETARHRRINRTDLSAMVDPVSGLAENRTHPVDPSAPNDPQAQKAPQDHSDQTGQQARPVLSDHQTGRVVLAVEHRRNPGLHLMRALNGPYSTRMKADTMPSHPAPEAWSKS